MPAPRSSPEFPDPEPGSIPPRRGPGRPSRPEPQPLPDDQTCAALSRLLEIRDKRRSGQRYWDFPFGGYADRPANGGSTPRPRQISVHEAISKLRAAEVLLGNPVEGAVATWSEQPADARLAVGFLLGRLGRSERPRWLSDRTYSWRRLEAVLYRVATDAQDRKEPFGAAPSSAALKRELGVSLRTYQKALARIRHELAEKPGLHVRVNLWLGDPPEGHTAVGPPGWLWVSRWHSRDEREAAAAGLMRADTTKQARAARRELAERHRKLAVPPVSKRRRAR